MIAAKKMPVTMQKTVKRSLISAASRPSRPPIVWMPPQPERRARRGRGRALEAK
jgi:hypothetical protein